ncbi:cytochrome c [Bacillus sp. V3B]|uniref:c-type cytochrome n=1 Tax=Bacillus sp. V3B TaxID=2804915 RepID=UPI00210E8183|nr:cytochrome c [Bacillus sp. V3B]MCQ6275721.1 cytochrome c [Bacillus sp. V3B]
MKGELFALLMGVSLVLAACGGSDDTTTTETADPEKIYTQSCSRCHGGDLKGRGPAADLSAIGARLSVEDIEKVIAEGKKGMAPRLIEGAEAKAVAEWLGAKK